MLNLTDVVQRDEDGTVDRMRLMAVGIALIAIDAVAIELAEGIGHAESIDLTRAAPCAFACWALGLVPTRTRLSLETSTPASAGPRVGDKR